MPSRSRLATGWVGTGGGDVEVRFEVEVEVEVRGEVEVVEGSRADQIRPGQGKVQADSTGAVDANA